MDIEHIKGLVELMVSNDLSRIEIKEGDRHILLRRGQATVVSTLPAMTHAPVAMSAAGSSTPAAQPQGGASAPAPAASNEIVIKSPMVGTYYAKPDPDSPQFVNIGDNVGPQTVVCLIEAMKVFNEIKAEVAGRVTKILVSNGQAVEYDQPLFALTPA